MFKKGDYVSYRADGVCVISDIRTERFAALNKSEEYYILSPLGDSNSQIYVAVSNTALTSQMKPLLSQPELEELVSTLDSEKVVWNEDSRARAAQFKAILSLGDRRELLLLVKTIHERIIVACFGGKKKLTAGDENAYRRAKRMLVDEFSKTCDIKTEDDLLALIFRDTTVKS